MYLAVAHIYNNKGHMKKIRLFNMNNLQFEDLDIEQVKQKLETGERIKGHLVNYNNSKSGSIKKIKQQNYNAREITRIQDNGEITNKDKLTVIGYTGFGKNTVYIMVNYLCEIKKIHCKYIDGLLKNNKILGMRKVDDEIIIDRDLNKELGIL